MLTLPAAYHGRVRAGTHIASTESVTDPEPRIAYESELEVDIVETPEFNGMADSLSRCSVCGGTGASLSAWQRTTGPASPSPQPMLALERDGEDAM